MDRRTFLAALVVVPACWGRDSAASTPAGGAKPLPVLEPAVKGLPADPVKVEKLVMSNEEWKKILDPEAYHVLREQGTDPPFRNRYHDNHAKGIYACAGCGLNMFSSDDKFESGTGWPSFTRPLKADRIEETKDGSLGMIRVEIACARCGGHQGHVFDDGPKPTGLRYCLDSSSMIFRPATASP